MQVVFFDVDNTLMRGYSGFYTTLLLIRKKIIRRRHLIAAIFYKVASPLFKGNVRTMYRMAIRDMAGRSLEEVLKIGQECFEKDIRPRLYREGEDLIGRLKKQGIPIYLLTSGPAMTIEILARYLGVAGHASAGPVVEGGILQNRLREPLPYREGKVVAAEELLRRRGVGFEEAAYYADNRDDLPLLEKVGSPFLVNPDRRLKKIGKKRGWPILTWR